MVPGTAIKRNVVIAAINGVNAPPVPHAMQRASGASQMRDPGCFRK